MNKRKIIGSTKPPRGSFPFTFSKDDATKVAVGALVAMGGALVTYLATWSASLDLTTNEGILLSAASAIVLNFLRKYLTNTTG